MSESSMGSRMGYRKETGRGHAAEQPSPFSSRNPRQLQAAAAPVPVPSPSATPGHSRWDVPCYRSTLQSVSGSAGIKDLAAKALLRFAAASRASSCCRIRHSWQRRHLPSRQTGAGAKPAALQGLLLLSGQETAGKLILRTERWLGEPGDILRPLQQINETARRFHGKGAGTLPLLQHTLLAAAQPALELLLRGREPPAAQTWHELPRGRSASRPTAAPGAGSAHHPPHLTLLVSLHLAENNPGTNPRTPHCRRCGDIATRATSMVLPSSKRRHGLGAGIPGRSWQSDSAALSVPPGLCAYESLGTGEGAGRSRSPRAYRRGRE